jgi:hypothetical protein
VSGEQLSEDGMEILDNSRDESSRGKRATRGIDCLFFSGGCLAPEVALKEAVNRSVGAPENTSMFLPV